MELYSVLKVNNISGFNANLGMNSVDGWPVTKVDLENLFIFENIKWLTVVPNVLSR